MDYWLERCSICFDHRMEFCLQPCRDQYCFECFQRYVREVVNNSWGLSITEVKCPVCMDVLSQYEWKQYADEETVRRYDEYNKPYRAFSRHCHACDSEINALEAPDTDLEHEHRAEALVALCDRLEAHLRDTSPTKEPDAFSGDMLKRFRADAKNFAEGGSVGIGSMFAYVARRRRINVRMQSARDIEANAIAVQLCRLEIDASVWRDLQFRVVSLFPKTRCGACSKDICMQCGEQTHHHGATCREYLERMLIRRTRSTGGHIDDLRWKLEHSKPCPNCRVLIDRDDGCNRVDCLYCGHRFCWICTESWSEVSDGRVAMAGIRIVLQRLTQCTAPNSAAGSIDAPRDRLQNRQMERTMAARRPSSITKESRPRCVRAFIWMQLVTIGALTTTVLIFVQ
ncbi:hypothetical protein THASP1DRAFT_18073 [Thamnocephalis sphaerospora]|uniref:RING-type domain-containing protein n=1 Tax=Thamnocephalis sphaerospora TaxID=78915 RepID=A0A4P9XLP6_9FUNG|nr:hypothetical protein THASP1DRAFT_18073 [Thamnocephalis sphaerospora]|eukprot:RKP06736.1 hypothetical protein THASP1DRAFT_18073 [Thamnocephalis sphaerospora]